MSNTEYPRQWLKINLTGLIGFIKKLFKKKSHLKVIRSHSDAFDDEPFERGWEYDNTDFDGLIAVKDSAGPRETTIIKYVVIDTTNSTTISSLDWMDDE